MKNSLQWFTRLRQISEGKIVSAKAKALTVEKVIGNGDQNEFKGLETTN